MTTTRLLALKLKYAILYNWIGLQNLVIDILMKRKNRTDLLVNSGKTAVITGGTQGIGMEVIKLLLKCDINVIIGCRRIEVANGFLPQFRNEGITRGNIEVYYLDLMTMESVRKFASEVKSKQPKIDYLINNAGIMFGPYRETPDGYESQIATNYLGHFLLTYLLLPELKKAGKANSNSRIVNVSSCAHLVGKINFEDINFKNEYVPALSYAQSKLALLLFSCYLNDILIKEHEHVQVHAVHPGLVNTNLFKDTNWKKFIPWMVNLCFKTPEQGAFSLVHACLSPSLEGKGGTYIQNCHISSPSNLAKNVDLQEKLFNFTKELLDIQTFSRLA